MDREVYLATLTRLGITPGKDQKKNHFLPSPPSTGYPFQFPSSVIPLLKRLYGGTIPKVTWGLLCTVPLRLKTGKKKASTPGLLYSLSRTNTGKEISILHPFAYIPPYHPLELLRCYAIQKYRGRTLKEWEGALRFLMKLSLTQLKDWRTLGDLDPRHIKQVERHIKKVNRWRLTLLRGYHRATCSLCKRKGNHRARCKHETNLQNFIALAIQNLTLYLLWGIRRMRGKDNMGPGQPLFIFQECFTPICLFCLQRKERCKAWEKHSALTLKRKDQALKKTWQDLHRLKKELGKKEGFPVSDLKKNFSIIPF